MEEKEKILEEYKEKLRQGKINEQIESESKNIYLSLSQIPSEYISYKWFPSGSPNEKFYNPEFNPQGWTVGEKTITTRIRAREMAQRYVSHMRKKSGVGCDSFLIMGGKNSGKTVLATLILREFIMAFNKDALFVPYSKMVVDGNVYLKDDINHFTSLYVEPEILCIDDMDGAKKISDKFISYLENILITRKYNGSPTIITSRICVETIRQKMGSAISELLDDPHYWKTSVLSHDEQEKGVDFIYTGHAFNVSLLINKLKEYRTKSKKIEIDSDSLQDILIRSIHE